MHCVTIPRYKCIEFSLFCHIREYDKKMGKIQKMKVKHSHFDESATIKSSINF